MAHHGDSQNCSFRVSPRRLNHQAGQAVAELAVTLFILVSFLFSILELGLMLNAKLVLASAAREIARVCAVKGGWTEEASLLISGIIEATGLSTGDVEVDISPRQAIYGTVINVRLSYNYRVKSAVIAAISRPGVTLTAKAVTRSEFVPR
ncbi:MAG: TadE/TadG family type IV pilus assembly protein [Bacillota bacterium]|jgi:hypothetical protein